MVVQERIQSMVRWGQRFPYDYMIPWQIHRVPVNSPNSADPRRRAAFQYRSMAIEAALLELQQGDRHIYASAMRFYIETFCRMFCNRMARLQSEGRRMRIKFVLIQMNCDNFFMFLHECVGVPNRRFAVENTFLQHNKMWMVLNVRAVRMSFTYRMFRTETAFRRYECVRDCAESTVPWMLDRIPCKCAVVRQCGTRDGDDRTVEMWTFDCRYRTRTAFHLFNEIKWGLRLTIRHERRRCARHATPVCSRLCFFRKYFVVKDLPHVVQSNVLSSLLAFVPLVEHSLLLLLLSSASNFMLDNSSLFVRVLLTEHDFGDFCTIGKRFSMRRTPAESLPCTMRQCKCNEPSILKRFEHWLHWKCVKSLQVAALSMNNSCTSCICIRRNSAVRNVQPQNWQSGTSPTHVFVATQTDDFAWFSHELLIGEVGAIAIVGWIGDKLSYVSANAADFIVWLSKWMVSLSKPIWISLQIGQISGRFVTLIKLERSESMLAKFGWLHNGHCRVAADAIVIVHKSQSNTIL